MGTLSVYNQDTFNEDMMSLALPEGAEKYRDWQDHQNGAEAFTRLTLIIAMRDYLINETDTDPDTLTSPNAVNKAYLSSRQYDANADVYVLQVQV